jgi:aldehyde dehydrogenase (NAD+)
MANSIFPSEVPNWIHGRQVKAASGESFEKLNPASGKVLCKVTRSRAAEIRHAVEAAKQSQRGWADIPAVKRGDILYEITMGLRRSIDDVAGVVALETGKSFKEAMGETQGAIALGRFFASEGQRLYGRTTTSGVENKYAMTIRQPLGVAGLITAANTPIANVAWKVFPALVCGNSVVLKAAEDTPATAWIFSKIAHEAGLPDGVLNVVQGFGEEAGAPLVADPEVDVISFTGSTAVGRRIAVTAGNRLAKVSLELGGKNPLVVCDDADLQSAAKWTLLSAFSNAGQRCAAASRIIVFNAIYDQFCQMLIERTKQLRVGPGDNDDFGPVINEKQLKNMIGLVQRAQESGARMLTGGHRLIDPDHRDGFYMAATLIENVSSDDEISRVELFGPIACLYRAKDFADALSMANDSAYGLTASIHTRNLHRAVQFAQKVQAGVAVVNAGTYGSEPHMPFGGLKQSGNGSREPGTEALDVYSDLKDVYVIIDPKEL